jgi:CHAD domain-containing protein
MQDPVNIMWQHWKKTQKEAVDNLSSLQQRINSVAVHDVRVAIKRLRAYLHLYILLKKEPDWDYFLTKTNQFFAILGRYRDIEICRLLTASLEKETNSSSKEFNNYLQQLQKTSRAWANGEVHRYSKKELAKIALLLKQDETLADKAQFSTALSGIIYDRLAATKKHFREPHQLRKNLKEVYYWISLFPEENAAATWYSEDLHKILDDLGEWQDHEILDVRIRHYRKDWLPKPFAEYQLLKSFRGKIKDRKRVLLENARRNARSWLAKVAEKEKVEG